MTKASSVCASTMSFSYAPRIAARGASGVRSRSTLKFRDSRAVAIASTSLSTPVRSCGCAPIRRALRVMALSDGRPERLAEQAFPAGLGHRQGRAAHSQLAVDTPLLGLDGPLRHSTLLGDRGEVVSLGHVTQNLELGR